LEKEKYIYTTYQCLLCSFICLHHIRRFHKVCKIA
jgi:hypothetical protein